MRGRANPLLLANALRNENKGASSRRRGLTRTDL